MKSGMKKISWLLFFLCLSLSGMLKGMSAPSKALAYKIDPLQSSLIIHTNNSGLFASAGHKLEIKAQDLSGTLRFDPASFAGGSLEMQVASASLKLQNEVSEKDRKEIEETLCGKVLECSLFPLITFKSSGLEAKDAQTHTLTGDLNLHGVTRSLPIDVQIQHQEGQLEAKGEFKIKQSDFKIKPPSALGGAIKVKDELRISFDIIARP